MTPLDETVFERMAKSSHELLLRGRVRGAMHTPLLLCGVIVLPSIGATLVSTGAVQAVFLGLSVFPVVLFAAAYLYFMLTRPDFLLSEEYNLQKKALELIEEKGGTIPVAASSLAHIANPYVPSLGKGEVAE